MAKTTTVGFRLAADLVAELDRVAAEEDIHRMDLMRHMLAHGFHQLRKQRMKSPQQRFDHWWFEEGRHLQPLPGEDRPTFARRVTQLAWYAAQDHITLPNPR